MTLKVYQYPQCGTCRKAIKWLKDQGHEVEPVHIVEHPPSEQELAELMEQSGLPIGKFFNVSGVVYRELGLKDKLPEMSDEEKIRLLNSNGMLIKRPIVSDEKKATVGYNEQQYSQVWG